MTRQVTIGGASFELNLDYAAGHALNEAEASTLNQVKLENIRNNANGKIKAAKEAWVKAGNTEDTFSLDTPGADGGPTLRSQIQDYANNYEFGIRSATVREPIDPTEREARAQAKDILAAALKDQGIKRKDVPDEAYEQALATIMATDDVQAEAKRRVKAREKIGQAALAGLDFGSKAEAEPAAA